MATIMKRSHEVIEDGKVFRIETDGDGKEHKRFICYTPEKQREIDDEDARRKQDLILKEARQRNMINAVHSYPDHALNFYQEASGGITLAIIQINPEGIQNVITPPRDVEDYIKKIQKSEREIADLKRKIPEYKVKAGEFEKNKKFKDAEQWYNITTEKERMLVGLQHHVENLKENKARAEIEYREKMKEFSFQVDSIMEPFRAVIKEEKKK